MSVTVYTQPDCLPCKRVMRKLADAGIPFDSVDILKDEDGYKHVKSLGAKSTPVITSDVMDPILGYDPIKLKDLIVALNNEQIHDHVYEGDE